MSETHHDRIRLFRYLRRRATVTTIVALILILGAYWLAPAFVPGSLQNDAAVVTQLSNLRLETTARIRGAGFERGVELVPINPLVSAMLVVVAKGGESGVEY